VAGAGPGVGLAVARRFARDGRPVALIARRSEALEAMAAQIAAEGGSARGYAADLSDLAGLQAALNAALAEMGPPGLLVWNAARWIETPALALDPAAFEAELRLGVVGALAAAQLAAAAMTEGGTILFTGGGLALAPQFGGAVPALTAAKAALRALTLAAAPEFAARTLHLATVTIAGVVAPGGPFDPDRIAEAFHALDAEPRGAWTVERVFDGG
jgi:NAD(P)-dependent dehydrogenase (short-subunit alcohol dehydrogenase family)